jgi:hypothetical protein
MVALERAIAKIPIITTSKFGVRGVYLVLTDDCQE